ncbi:hypothetical protein C1646_774840 [Rhizophagus diaphanus]|nr:hypothetical protein C1646_774840 [Rhizophagus diaphanus] [Rhizophagus sp. MUCL 43196]
MSKQLFEINTNKYLEHDLTNIQRQEIYTFIFLPGEKSMQNPPFNSNRDNTLSNITNLMDNNNKTAQFTIVNSMSDDDDDQKMQLFKDYKLILCQAL